MILGSRGRSSRGGEMGQWGRRRHPRAHKHVRNVFSVVHITLTAIRVQERSLSRPRQFFFHFPELSFAINSGELVADFNELLLRRIFLI